VNKNEFDDVVEQGDAALKRAVKFDPFFAIAIALLAFVGIRPRLREYTA
jgi:hypothetical protein